MRNLSNTPILDINSTTNLLHLTQTVNNLHMKPYQQKENARKKLHTYISDLET